MTNDNAHDSEGNEPEDVAVVREFLCHNSELFNGDFADPYDRCAIHLERSLNRITKLTQALDAANARIAELEEWMRGMVEKAAQSNNLEGYRELGAKCADLEASHDRLKIELQKKLTEVEALRRDAVTLFNHGYGCGHNDTVEGSYVDVHPSDMDSYHDDIVSDLLDGMRDDRAR